ncbi:MAG: hypothetical protein SCALA702_11100 [Melioribacteraceae bacterium]|nr:MAG: hypothetical protein SCALA702_11100 [Melioribacteraceae bacterium]
MKNKIERSEYLINLYYDKEISRKEENELFEILSDNEAARELFKKMRMIEGEVSLQKEAFPEQLDAKILNQLSSISSVKKNNNSELISILKYAAVIVFAVITSYLFFLNTQYASNLERAEKQIKKQEVLINQVINNMPAAEVTPNQTEQIVIVSNL